ncbi:MAG: energy-coupled thiamine transporter ThiT [Lachnospiraceae bacterium]|nr:energy-coupled thiamine transporter ThiT [Lachnospiraceae bacterium]MDE7185142.1 energy-coupled thiamine transporter ThiT [Lachnospiraceae bacterium]
MLYNVVVNDWDETTYVPTALGNGLLLAAIAILLLAAVAFAKIHMQMEKSEKSEHTLGTAGDRRSGKLTVRQLVFCAMAVALATVLSNIKLFHFPTGGSITLLSMLVACLPGYFFGLGAGLMTGLAYGVLQLLVDPYVLYPMQLVMDYLLAFGALGLSGLFSNAKNGLLKGYMVGVLGRYVFTVASGCIFFASYAWEGWGVLPYSLVYNGIYIFAEAGVSIVVILLVPVKSAIGRIRRLALEG